MDKMTRIEEQMCRYVDGEMKPEEAAEFELLLARDEGLSGEVEAMRRVGAAARAAAWRAELPAPELFREQVMREVERSAGGAWAGRGARRARAGGLGWAGLPWAVAGLSVAAAVVVMLADLGGGMEDGDSLVGAYAPQDSVTAEWRYDREAQATVIELEGLPELPADFDVAGLRAAGTERGMASRTPLGRDGSPGMVVVHNGRSAAVGFRIH